MQGLGHIASECPVRKVITLVEYEASEGKRARKRLMLHGRHRRSEKRDDERKLLVLRRALSCLKGNQDEQ